jgi:hypothetical protein
MFALSHDEFGFKSTPLSPLKTSPGFWFLVAAVADGIIVWGGLAGLVMLGVLAVAGVLLWPTLAKVLRSW